jgi:hypothetical protein
MQRAIYLLIIAGVLTFGSGALARPALAAPARTDIPASDEAGFAGPLAIRTDGSFVAWSSQFEPNRFNRYANLYVAALGDSQPTTVESRLNFILYLGPLQPSFDLDNGTLVWIDAPIDQPQSFPLRARNLRTGETKTVAETRASFPAISGNTVVWWENVGIGGALGDQPAALMARDIGTMSAPIRLTQIAPTRDSLLGGVRVSERWVIWRQGSLINGDSNAPCWDLYAVPITGGEPQRIDSLECGAGNLTNDGDLSGDTVTYTNTYHVLVTRNLTTGVNAYMSGPHANRGNAFDGRYVFWNRPDAPVLWGFDPASDSAFPIDQQPYQLTVPAARNGAVAWFGTTNGQDVRIRARAVAELLPSVPRAATDPAVAGRRYFPETGHSLGGAFGDYWQRNGGLPVFGYALTEEFVQRAPESMWDYTTQYFERQRFEYHPENAGTPYEVLLGRLGAEALAAQGRDWQALPKAGPQTPHYFAATGQAIAPEFWGYWRTHGLEFGDRGVSEREALALWGYPITPPAYEQVPTGETLLVQWFERARFEYHPNNPNPYKVLLGRLAADRVDAFGWR